MDIKLAGSVLAVASFTAGTIVPLLYKRFAYEGVSLKQPLDLRMVFEDQESVKWHQVVFCTPVKVANALKESLIIDDIQADPVRTQITRYDFVGVDLRTSEPGQPILLPPHVYDPATLNHLPLLVKSDSELTIALGLWFKYDVPPPAAIRTATLLEAAHNPGIMVRFRINGKYRRYVLRAKPSARWADAPSQFDPNEKSPGRIETATLHEGKTICPK